MYHRTATTDSLLGLMSEKTNETSSTGTIKVILQGGWLASMVDIVAPDSIAAQASTDRASSMLPNGTLLHIVFEDTSHKRKDPSAASTADAAVSSSDVPIVVAADPHVSSPSPLGRVLVVLHPDLVLSPSRVLEAQQCLRKAVIRQLVGSSGIQAAFEPEWEPGAAAAPIGQPAAASSSSASSKSSTKPHVGALASGVLRHSLFQMALQRCAGAKLLCDRAAARSASRSAASGAAAGVPSAVVRGLNRTAAARGFPALVLRQGTLCPRVTGAWVRKLIPSVVRTQEARRLLLPESAAEKDATEMLQLAAAPIASWLESQFGARAS